MIVPQIKPSNLCIKLGHKAYFLLPLPPSQLLYMLVPYITQSKKYAEGQSFVVGSSAYLHCVLKVQLAVNLKSESKQSVFYRGALWIHYCYAAH